MLNLHNSSIQSCEKRLTLALRVETVRFIKDTAKVRNITASQFVEEVLEKIIAEEAKDNLKKVS